MCTFIVLLQRPVDAHNRCRNKAVAEGAVSFYLDHRVGSRMSRFTYGVNCHVPYNPNDEEHRLRSICSWLSPSGLRRLPGFFSAILPKVCIGLLERI
jgi:hypothetical protein